MNLYDAAWAATDEFSIRAIERNPDYRSDPRSYTRVAEPTTIRRVNKIAEGRTFWATLGVAGRPSGSAIDSVLSEQ